MALPTEDGEIQHQCELSFPEQSVGKELASKLAGSLGNPPNIWSFERENPEKNEGIHS